MKNLFSLTLRRVFRLTLEEGKIDGFKYYFVVKHLYDEAEYFYKPTSVLKIFYNRDEAIINMQKMFDELKVAL